MYELLSPGTLCLHPEDRRWNSWGGVGWLGQDGAGLSDQVSVQSGETELGHTCSVPHSPPQDTRTRSEQKLNLIQLQIYSRNCISHNKSLTSSIKTIRCALEWTAFVCSFLHLLLLLNIELHDDGSDRFDGSQV